MRASAFCLSHHLLVDRFLNFKSVTTSRFALRLSVAHPQMKFSYDTVQITALATIWAARLMFGQIPIDHLHHWVAGSNEVGDFQQEIIR